MKTTLLSVLFFAMITGAFAQDLNKMHFDERLQKEILIDLCDRSGLENDDYFGSYFTSEYEAYESQEETIKALKSKIKDVKLKIVLGTWCGDSKRQVPRLYKVLDQVGFKDKNISVLAVNRSKKTVSADISKLDIKYVPTIIIYKDGKELGRIIESPELSLEEDLLKIIE